MRFGIAALLDLVTAVTCVAIWQIAAPLFARDCGTADQRTTDFVETGRDCLWSAYSAGESAKWTMTRSTLEGDPIAYVVTVRGQSVELMQDTSADRFGGPNRGRMTWRCSDMTKVARPTGSFRLAFSGCSDAALPPGPL